MTEITLRNRQRAVPVRAAFLRRIILQTLRDPLFASHGPAEPEHTLGFHLVSSEEMARVNQQFLQHEGPTDVITLDYSDDAAGQDSGLCGDIFLCPEVAVEQAREYGTGWREELVRYIVHSLLHLRGFDDVDPVRRRLMKREENRLFKKLATLFPLSDLTSEPTVVP